MKIFIGGLLPPRQEQIREWYPGVKFEFASDQESDRLWVSCAQRADLIIIDQGRTTHRIIDQLRRRRIKYRLADGTAEIRKIIEENTNEQQRVDL